MCWRVAFYKKETYNCCSMTDTTARQIICLLLEENGIPAAENAETGELLRLALNVRPLSRTAESALAAIFDAAVGIMEEDILKNK